jgi:pimeloyl-ACP methyl ester carboxylesterase
VYALDLLGHGRSEKPRLTYSAYLHAALVRDFVKHVIRGNATVVAEGRSAALAVKGFYLIPEHIKKLVLIKPKASPPGLLYAGVKKDLTEIKIPVRIVRGGKIDENTLLAL